MAYEIDYTIEMDNGVLKRWDEVQMKYVTITDSNITDHLYFSDDHWVMDELDITINSTTEYYALKAVGSAVTISVIGENHVALNNVVSGTAVFSSNVPVTFQGSGTLSLTASDVNSGTMYALSVANTLTLKESVTVTATAGNAPMQSVGAGAKNLVISDTASLTASSTGNNKPMAFSQAMWSDISVPTDAVTSTDLALNPATYDSNKKTYVDGDGNAITSLTIQAYDDRVVVTPATGTKENPKDLGADKTITVASGTANGGALEVQAGAYATGTNLTYASNSVTGADAKGGAIYNDGELSLNGGTFSGNSAAQGGAVYNAGKLLMTGDITLCTSTDTVYNEGSLIWNFTGDNTAKVVNYQYVTNAVNEQGFPTGTLGIWVDDKEQLGTYTIATGDLSDYGTNPKYHFSISTDGETFAGLSLNNEVYFNNRLYTLAVTDEDTKLTLTVAEGQAPDQRRVVDGATTIAQDTTYDFTSQAYYAGNGGIIEVQAGGTFSNSPTTELQFINGKSSGSDKSVTVGGESYKSAGGAIYSEGIVNLTNATFTSNKASGYHSGGAIYSANLLNLKESSFTGNTTGRDGGAICIAVSNPPAGGCSAVISDTTFTNNSADFSGGAIRLQEGTMKLTNVTFTGNTGKTGGGAIAIHQGTEAVIDQATFSQNTTSASGGAIYNTASEMTITSAKFTGNKANGGDGGAIVNGNILNLDNVTFGDGTDAGKNTATGNGNAIYNKGTINLKGNVYLEDNTETVYLDSSAKLNWVISAPGSINGYLSDYSLIQGTKSAATLTIDAEDALKGSYTLAGNASTASDQEFTITTASAASQTIKVNGDAVIDGDITYSLAVDSENNLILSAVKLEITITPDGVYVDDNEVNWVKKTDSDATITVEVSEPNDAKSLLYTVNGSTDRQYTSGQVFALKLEEDSTYKFNAASGACKAEKEYIVSVDGAGPEITDITQNGVKDSNDVYWFKQGVDARISATVTDTADGTNPGSGIAVATLNGERYTSGSEARIETFYETSAEGIEYVFAAADNVGNMAEEQSVKIGVDGTGPKIEVAESGTGEDTEVTITVTDDLSGVGGDNSKISYSLNGKEFTEYNDIPVETGSDYTLVIKATDNVGNESMFFYAAGTPAITITAEGVYKAANGNWVAADSEAEITVTTSADKSMDIRTNKFDGEDEGSFENGDKFPLFASTGEHTYEFYVKTFVGSTAATREKTATYTFKVDSTAPTVAVSDLTGGVQVGNVYWYKQGANAFVTATGTDTESGVKSIKLNGSTSENGAALRIETLYETDKNGSVYSFTATDNVGNESAAVSRTIGVDGTGPTIGDTTLAGNPMIGNVSGKWIKAGTAATVTTEIKDDKSGFAGAELEGAEYDGTKFTINATGDTEITGHLITATDKVGNESIKLIAYGVDGSGAVFGADTITGEHVSGRWVQAGSKFAVNMEITDAKSGFCDANIEGVEYRDGKFSLTAGADETEITSHNVTASDNVGNLTYTEVFYGIDGTGPAIGETTLSGSNTYNNLWVKAGSLFAVETEITDAKSGLASADIDGVEYDGAKFTLLAGKEGNVNTTITALDNVDNSSTKDVSYRIDGTGPSITITSVPVQELLCTSVTVTARFADGLSGLASAEYSFNGVDWMGALVGDTVTVENITENKTVYFRAFDNVGNESTDEFIVSNIVREENPYVVNAVTRSLNEDLTAADFAVINNGVLDGLEGKTLTANNLTLKDGVVKNINGVIDNITVKSGINDISGMNKLLVRDTVTVESGNLSVSKQQYNEFFEYITLGVNGALIVTDAGTVSQKEIERLQTSSSINDITFKDASLTEIRKLTFAKATEQRIGFRNLAGTDRKDTIAFKKNAQAVLTGDIDLAAGADAVKLQSNAKLLLNGALSNVTSLKLSSGSVYKENGSSYQRYTEFVAGNVTLSNDRADTFSAGNYTKVQTGVITGGVKKDKLSVGKNAVFTAQAMTGIEKVSFGASTSAQFGSVTGTAANDSYSLGNWNDVELASLDFGDGNDTLKIGSNAEVDISSLDFGAGSKDKLTIGKGATLNVDTLDVLSLDKLSMGKDSKLVIADADDLAAAKAKWAKYDTQIVAKAI